MCITYRWKYNSSLWYFESVSCTFAWRIQCQFSLVETPHKFVIAKLSIRRLGSSSVLIIRRNCIHASLIHVPYWTLPIRDMWFQVTLTDCNSPEGDSAVKGFAIIPYIQGVAEPIRRVLWYQCCLKPFRTLGHIFAKPKDRVPTDRKTNTVHCISCGDCEKVYLGQTKRQFCTRLKEHQRVVSNFNS